MPVRADSVRVLISVLWHHPGTPGEWLKSTGGNLTVSDKHSACLLGGKHWQRYRGGGRDFSSLNWKRGGNNAHGTTGKEGFGRKMAEARLGASTSAGGAERGKGLRYGPVGRRSSQGDPRTSLDDSFIGDTG